jgi:hypothetical protein
MESMMVIPGGVAPLLMGICHLLTALVVYALARRFLGRGPALVAVLIYLLLKKVYLFATLAYIDQGLTYMRVLGIYAAVRYMEKPSRALAALVGLTLGFACAIKYNALITVVLVAVVAVIYEAGTRRNFIRLLIDLVLAALVLALVASPWYIRNWVWFHNPVFPFYASLFPTTGGTYAHLAPDLSVDHQEMLEMFAVPFKRDPVRFLVLPFYLTFNPLGPYELPNVGVVGPWFLMTLPLVILLRRFPRALWAILGLIVGTFCYWWFIEQMVHLRYMLPVFALQAVFAGFLVWDGLRLDRVQPRSSLSWLALAGIFGILVTFFAGVVTPEQVRGQFPILPEERRQFVLERMNAYPVIESVNEALRAAGTASETRVYGFYAEQYRWYADFTLVGNQVGFADHTDYFNHCHSASELYEWLKSYDCDYLIVNLAYAQLALGDEAARAVPAQMDGWEEYFEQEKTLYWVLLYRLK